MEKFDKILELLEKKTLTEAEKKLLKEFADSDEEINSFIRIHLNARAVTKENPGSLLPAVHRTLQDSSLQFRDTYMQ